MYHSVVFARQQGIYTDPRCCGNLFYRNTVQFGQFEYFTLFGRKFGQSLFQFHPHQRTKVFRFGRGRRLISRQYIQKTFRQIGFALIVGIIWEQLLLFPDARINNGIVCHPVEPGRDMSDGSNGVVHSLDELIQHILQNIFRIFCALYPLRNKRFQPRLMFCNNIIELLPCRIIGHLTFRYRLYLPHSIRNDGHAGNNGAEEIHPALRVTFLPTSRVQGFGELLREIFLSIRLPNHRTAYGQGIQFQWPAAINGLNTEDRRQQPIP